MKVIVTGYREWPAPGEVFRALDLALMRAVFAGEGLTVIHGACPTGADMHAECWARIWARDGAPVDVKHYPADWDRLKRAAGPIRNEQMVDENPDAALVLAFLHPESRGTVQCRNYAKQQALEVVDIELGDPETRAELRCDGCGEGLADVYDDGRGGLHALCAYCADDLGMEL